MPFRETGETGETSQPRREIIVRKEVIRQVPLMTGTMDSLTVNSLTVRDISLADPSVFYPPNPHILKNPYLHFQDNETVVGLKIGNTPFLEYSKHSKKVRCENIETSNVLLQTVSGTTGSFQTLSVNVLNVPTLDLSLLKVDRIEALSNILGGVVLRDGGFSAPGDVNVGSHFIANTGNVGGVAFKDASTASKHVCTTSLSAEHIVTDRIHCTSPYIVLGNVQLMSGEIKCKNIRSEQGNFGRMYCTSLESDDRISIVSGISTPSGSIHDLGNLSIRESNAIFPGTFESSFIQTKKLECEDIFTETIEASSATIGGVNIQDNCINTHACKVDHLSVTENIVSFSNVKTQNVDAANISTVNLVAENIQASDFRLKDGTSILNAVFPPGMIMLYNGKAPRGWLECNGKGGTPNLPSPAPNVIYIVRR